MTPISTDQYERVCFTCGACTSKPWVSLTDEELNDVAEESEFGYKNLARAIEAALRKKNDPTPHRF